MRILLFTLLFIAFSVVSDDNASPTAVIEDSYTLRSGGGAYVFYVESIDGKEVFHSLNALRVNNNGTGMVLRPAKAEREVIAKELVLQLRAKTFFTTGFMRMVKDEPEAAHQITFTPQAGRRYRVRGILDPNYSALWLEEFDGEYRSEKFETRGEDKQKAEVVAQRAEQLYRRLTPQTPLERFIAIERGDTAASVRAYIGDPASKTSHEKTFFSEAPATDEFYYSEFGKIVFLKPFQTQIVESVHADLSAIAAKHGIDAVVTFLSHADDISVQNAAATLFRENKADPSLLDVVAQFSWNYRNYKDRRIEDAIAYFCKAIGNHGSLRYGPFLSSLSSAPVSSKIRKHAEQAHKKLKAETQETFIHSDDDRFARPPRT